MLEESETRANRERAVQAFQTDMTEDRFAEQTRCHAAHAQSLDQLYSWLEAARDLAEKQAGEAA